MPFSKARDIQMRQSSRRSEKARSTRMFSRKLFEMSKPTSRQSTATKKMQRSERIPKHLIVCACGVKV